MGFASVVRHFQSKISGQLLLHSQRITFGIDRAEFRIQADKSIKPYTCAFRAGKIELRVVIARISGGQALWKLPVLAQEAVQRRRHTIVEAITGVHYGSFFMERLPRDT